MKNLSYTTPFYFILHVLGHVLRYTLGVLVGALLLLITVIVLPLKITALIPGISGLAERGLKNIRTFLLERILLPASSGNKNVVSPISPSGTKYTQLRFCLGGNGDARNASAYDYYVPQLERRFWLPHLGADHVGDNTMQARVSAYVAHITACVRAQGSSASKVQIVLEGHSFGGAIMSQVLCDLKQGGALDDYQVEYTLILNRTFSRFSLVVQQNLIAGYGVLPEPFVRFVVDHLLGFALPVEDNVRYLLEQGVSVDIHTALYDEVLLGSALMAKKTEDDKLTCRAYCVGHNDDLSRADQYVLPKKQAKWRHNGYLMHKAARCIDCCLLGIALVVSSVLSPWLLSKIAMVTGTIAAPLVLYIPIALIMCYALTVAMVAIGQRHAPDKGVEKGVHDIAYTAKWLDGFSQVFMYTSIGVALITSLVIINFPACLFVNALLLALCVGISVTTISMCVAYVGTVEPEKVTVSTGAVSAYWSATGFCAWFCGCTSVEHRPGPQSEGSPHPGC